MELQLLIGCLLALLLGAFDFTKGTTVLGVIAAGCAVAGFIEALAKKWLPK